MTKNLNKQVCDAIESAEKNARLRLLLVVAGILLQLRSRKSREKQGFFDPVLFSFARPIPRHPNRSLVWTIVGIAEQKRVGTEYARTTAKLVSDIEREIKNRR